MGCSVVLRKLSTSNTRALPTLRRRGMAVSHVSKLVILAGALCFLQIKKSFESNGLSYIDTANACSNFVTDFQNMTSGHDVPKILVDMLSFIDHIYVISLDSCRFPMSTTLATKATCVHGRVLDACAPPQYFRGHRQELHGLKVTFTHAVVMKLAERSGFRHVAVIEDDLALLPGRVEKISESTTSAFASLLRSNSWSLIRIGFRPYFLQENGRQKCPKYCRCRTSPRFGSHFCEMRHGKCDVRSSDFYVIRSKYFLAFQRKLLDTRQSNVNRIVDMYPMRSLPNQWMFIPQISYQRILDIPVDYQIGSGALFIKKCVYPRPLSPVVIEQALVGDRE